MNRNKYFTVFFISILYQQEIIHKLLNKFLLTNFRIGNYENNLIQSSILNGKFGQKIFIINILD